MNQLIKHLENKAHPSIIFKYKSQDWKNKISFVYGSPCPYPQTLWKNENETMKLVLFGWREQQSFYYYSGYGAVYANVLDGLLCHHAQRKMLVHFGDLPKHYLLKPNTTWNVRSKIPSTSLFLFCRSDQR